MRHPVCHYSLDRMDTSSFMFTLLSNVNRKWEGMWEALHVLILIRMKMYSRGLLLHFKREISNHFPRNFPTANSEQNYCPHISFKKRHFNRHLLLQFAVFQTILKLEIGKFGNWIFLFTYEVCLKLNLQKKVLFSRPDFLPWKLLLVKKLKFEKTMPT